MGQLFQRALGYISGAGRGPAAAAVRAALRALSLPYGLGVQTRAALYRAGILPSCRLDTTVISVGNLTTGGTGKTPLVVWLARWMTARGVPVAILSRGYGSTGPDGSDSDETLLFRRQLTAVPHLVGKDRAATGARAIAEHGAQCLLLDDGFQHLAVERDLNLAVVDTLLPFGYGHLLPRGLLREPVRALRRADLVVLTRCDLCGPDALAAVRSRIAEVCGPCPVVESVHRPVRLTRHGGAEEHAPEWLRGRRIYAFSALGNPQAFPRTLAPLGADLVAHRTFRDHHWYSQQDLERLAQEARERGAEALVTTEKDAGKIEAMPDGAPPLYVLAVEFAPTRGEAALQDALETLLPR